MAQLLLRRRDNAESFKDFLFLPSLPLWPPIKPSAFLIRRSRMLHGMRVNYYHDLALV